MLNKSKLWALALLLAAFVAGAAVGAGAHAAAEGNRRGPRPSYVDRLARELSLTAPQRESVQQILDHYDTSMHELWREVRPRMDTIRLDIRMRISGVLTVDQRPIYDSLTQRWDSVRAAREAPHGR